MRAIFRIQVLVILIVASLIPTVYGLKPILAAALEAQSQRTAGNPFFRSLYDHPVPESVLDGSAKTFLANGYSTSNRPDSNNAWPAVLQKMLDEHSGAKDPSERIYHVFSHTVGSTPIARWSQQEGDLGCGDGRHVRNSIEWYVNPGSKLENGAPPATILLAQQSLQWAFDCKIRKLGIEDENDTARIEHGAREIEHFVAQFVQGGIETVYMATHIYQRNVSLSIPLFNEKHALKLALEFAGALRPGPYLWYATREIWPEGYANDLRHPDYPAANAMAVYWYLVLAGETADMEIVSKYANQYTPATRIPSAYDPFPTAEKITILEVASGQEVQVILDDDPYSYGLSPAAPLYVDDSAYWFDWLPDDVAGETYIKTPLADSAFSGDSYLSFDVDQDITLYIAHDEAINPRPGWLSAFEDTGVTLSAGKDSAMSLFKKDFAAGRIELGGNGGSEAGELMYSIIIVNHPSIPVEPIYKIYLPILQQISHWNVGATVP